MGIRRESVELSLNDLDFTTGMAKAAAQTALLNRELDHLDGTSTKANRSTSQLADDGIKRTGSQARQAESDLNRYTGRLNALVSAAVTLGPSLIPVTAGLIPGITGMAAGLGAAAGAAGVAMLAFHGIGDAMKALDTYSLQPTNANLDKLNTHMAAVGQGGEQLAVTLTHLEPALHQLQATAQQNMLPGLAGGLTELLPLLPQVEQLVANIAKEMGDLADKAGHGLASDSELQAFFHYLQTDAAPTLKAFATATGNVAAGLAQMTVDFAPINRDFSQGLVHATESFREWADGLSQTQGFRGFVAYLETNGPKAVQALEALGNAAVGIVEAFAPWGGVVLPVLTKLLNVIGAIGRSPLGPVIASGVAATLAFNTAGNLMSGLLTRLGVQTAALSAEMRGLAASEEAAAVAGAGLGSGRLSGVGAGLSGVIAGGSKAVGPIAAIALAAQGASWLGSIAGHHLSTTQNDLSIIQGNGAGGLGHLTNGINGLISDASFGLLQTPVQQAKQRLASKDLSLSGIVNGGQTAAAAQQVRALGLSVAETAKYLPNYTAAVKAAGSSTGSVATAAKAAAAAQIKQAASMKAVTDAHLGAFDAETNYRQALAAATDQAKKSNAGFKGNTAEVLQNRQALSQLAGAWNTQIQALASNGASMDKIKGKYADARRQIIAAAEGMGASAAEAKRYANQLLDIPASVNTRITADTSGADAVIAGLQAKLDRLNGRHVKTYVDVIQQGNLNHQIAVLQGEGRATGGFITGAGTATSDSIPAYLSNGEYVMRAAAVQKYGVAMFDHMNAMRYASGGHVSHPRHHFSSGVTQAGLTLAAADPTALLGSLTSSLDGLTQSLNGMPSVVDAATSALDDLISRRDSLQSSITGGLTVDPFAAPSGGVFSNTSLGGTFASAMAALTKQGANADSFLSAEQTLTDKGLSGPALQALLSTGNLSTVQNFAGQSAADLASYSQLYDTSTAKVTAASSYGGNASYGAQLNAVTTYLASLDAKVSALTSQQAALQQQADRSRQNAAVMAGRAQAKAHDHTARRARNK